jgi:hypothetical protein
MNKYHFYTVSANKLKNISNVLMIVAVVLLCKNSLAQNNVGIGTLTPTASALLELVSTDKGFLAPRLTTAQRLAIPSPANGLMVYDLNLECYYFYNAVTLIWQSTCTGLQGPPGPVGPPANNAWFLIGNAGINVATNFLGTTDLQPINVKTNNVTRFIFPVANQVHAAADGTAALPFYSFLNNTGMGAYRAGANILGFSTSGLERMRVSANGRFSLNTILTDGQLDVRSNFNTSLAGLSTILGVNTNATGTGLIAIGQGQAINAALTGSGASIIGNNLGLFIEYNASLPNPPVGDGIRIQNQIGDSWLVGSIILPAGTKRKIVGPGAVSTIVKDLEGNEVMLNCPESPENLYMDYGVGVLKDGFAFIEIDPILQKNIIVNELHPIKIFIQPEGNCNGVFVQNKSVKSFEVVELNNGKSNVSFSYQIVATMGDQISTDEKGVERTYKYTHRWLKVPEKSKTLKDLNK